MSFSHLSDRYKSDEGDALARQELLPVIRRYALSTVVGEHQSSLSILEVGCGFGRNLVALADIPHERIVGCDTSQGELAKARERLSRNRISTVELVHQKNEATLPFHNNAFDVVVLWQVLEHIRSHATKRAVLEECTRVLKPNGSLLIETPNFWFPFDYHDNRLPLVHWLLPDALRYRATRLLRDEDFPPSHYTSILEIRRWLRGSKHTIAIQQLSNIYFEKTYSDIFRHLGGTNVPLKRLFFLLYFPLYLLLRFLRLPGDLFTPSIRVVIQVEK